MKNPFLTILENPASLITLELDKDEQQMIVRMLEEKVNNAIRTYDNPEQHDNAIYEPFNKWLYYLNEMWDGKLNYTFEQWADTIGIQKYELYKMIIGMLLDKHLDHVIEHDGMLDNVMGMDVLNELNGLTIRNDSRINRDTNNDMSKLDNDELNELIDDPNSTYDSNGQLDNDTLNALKINR